MLKSLTLAVICLVISESQSTAGKTAECGESDFIAIKNVLGGDFSFGLVEMNSWDPTSWAEQRKKELQSNKRAMEKSNFGKLLTSMEEKASGCDGASQPPFVSKSTAETIVKEISNLGKKATDSSLKANLRRAFVALNILAALPEETIRAARRGLIKPVSDFFYSSDGDKNVADCEGENQELGRFQDFKKPGDQNWIVPLYLFLLNQYKCAKKVEKHYFEELLRSCANGAAFSSISETINKYGVFDDSVDEESIPADPKEWSNFRNTFLEQHQTDNFKLFYFLIKTAKDGIECRVQVTPFITEKEARAIADKISYLGSKKPKTEAKLAQTVLAALSDHSLNYARALLVSDSIDQDWRTEFFPVEDDKKCVFPWRDENGKNNKGIYSKYATNGNYLVPLYLFLLTRFKCLEKVTQSYLDYLTVQEKDDVADPGVQLEIIWRQMEFAKNLNQYFNSVSLAGITAGETAVRVQLQASLAELALRALDQYAKIEQMEKEAKEKLHATWEVMKEYVRDQ